ncbi:serine hydrolase domain-containing protein [Actinacidiphila yeochonensis]|uniref:serine hydrolase domain-containing protein n=1 Tax=Actinacidiphila yeochonensis TaxID=89050 RepID=UPI000A71EC7E|nr:serine hydrolase domain-containing protein [Actinacidiphila yeochonensis]
MSEATESAAGYRDAELLPGTRRALTHRVATEQSQGRAPSVVGALVRDGRMVWSGSASMVEGHEPDADTQYRIGSITKSFVAVLVMRLAEEGLVGLTDPVGAHLTDLRVPEVTVGQLLAHTSGLASETPSPWWERTPGTVRPELADVLGADPVRHPAGRRFHYSNPGYALLGALVEAKRGLPWHEALREEVLEPLGMRRTTREPQAPAAGGFAVHPWADVMVPEAVQQTGRMAPAGELWSTAADLSRWAAFLAGGQDGVLPATAVERMRESAAPIDPTAPDNGYGLGLQLLRSGGRSLAGHTGSMPGFLAAIWVSVADGLGAVAFANSTSGSAIGGFAADLLAIAADAEPRFPTPWRPADRLDPALLELAGPWYWGTSAFALRVSADGELSLARIGQAGRQGTRFHVEQDGTWTGHDGYYGGETLRVVRREDGSVSHLDLGSFMFTREPYDETAPIPGGFQGWNQGLSAGE